VALMPESLSDIGMRSMACVSGAGRAIPMRRQFSRLTGSFARRPLVDRWRADNVDRGGNFSFAVTTTTYTQRGCYPSNSGGCDGNYNNAEFGRRRRRPDQCAYPAPVRQKFSRRPVMILPQHVLDPRLVQPAAESVASAPPFRYNDLSGGPSVVHCLSPSHNPTRRRRFSFSLKKVRLGGAVFAGDSEVAPEPVRTRAGSQQQQPSIKPERLLIRSATSTQRGWKLAGTASSINPPFPPARSIHSRGI